jgi:trehalose-6-phosphatase
MQTQVEFRSSQFPPYEGEEEEINPGLWGKRLAEYLTQKLAERGIETEDFAVEDWGVYLPVKNEGFRLALCCGHQDGDEDQFLVVTEPSTPTVKKVFRTIDATAQLTRLLDVVREILAADPAIREVVWCDPR